MGRRWFDPWGLALGLLGITLGVCFLAWCRVLGGSFWDDQMALLSWALPQAALAAMVAPRIPGETLGGRVMLTALLHGAVGALAWPALLLGAAISLQDWGFSSIDWALADARDSIFFLSASLSSLGMVLGAGTALGLRSLRRPPLPDTPSLSPRALQALVLTSAGIIALSWEVFLWQSENVLGLNANGGNRVFLREPLSRLFGEVFAALCLASSWALLSRKSFAGLPSGAALILLAFLSLRESIRYIAFPFEAVPMERTLSFTERYISPIDDETGIGDAYIAVRGESTLWADDIIYTLPDESEERFRVGWGPFRISLDEMIEIRGWFVTRDREE